MTRRRLPRKCKGCGRKLHTPESRQLGYGPKCWRRKHPLEIADAKVPQVGHALREIAGQVDAFDLLAEDDA